MNEDRTPQASVGEKVAEDVSISTRKRESMELKNGEKLDTSWRLPKSGRKLPGNYMPSAFPGCYVCNSKETPPWVLSRFKLGSAESDACELRELAEENGNDMVLDPDTGILGVMNKENVRKCLYISVRSQCYGRAPSSIRRSADGRKFKNSKTPLSPRFEMIGKSDETRRGPPLPSGITTGADGKVYATTSLIASLEPKSFVRLCYVDVPDDVADLELESDIVVPQEHPNKDAWNPKHVVGFPISGEGPFLCTQGAGGSVTHYFAQSYHAIDVESPIGTPLVAVGDGVVVSVKQDNRVSGIGISNLFHWNEVSIKIDGLGLIAEYVHIKPGSALVKVGDRVKKGQVLCKSGQIGFCPRPHTHMEFHSADDPRGPSVKVAFADSEGKPYFCEAGKQYGPSGPM